MGLGVAGGSRGGKGAAASGPGSGGLLATAAGKGGLGALDAGWGFSDPPVYPGTSLNMVLPQLPQGCGPDWCGQR